MQQMIKKTIILHLFLFVLLKGLTVIAQKSNAYYLIDTVNFHTLQPSDRTLLSEYLPKIHEEKQDSLKIRLINEMYNSMSENDVWIDYARFMYQLAQQSKEIKQELKRDASINFFHDYGYYFDYIGNFDSSLYYYQKSYELAKPKNDIASNIAILRSIGAIQRYMGKYKDAIATFNEALYYTKQINDSSEIGFILLNLGKLNASIKEEEAAFNYIYESLKIRRKLKNKKNIAVSVSDLASMLDDFPDSVEKAMQFYKEAITLSKEVNNEELLCSIYNNIGAYHSNIGQYDSALFYQKNALEIAEKINFKSGYITMLSNIGKSYFQLNKLKEALEYGTKSMELAEKTQSAKTMKGPTILMYRIHKELGAYEKALYYYEKYIEARDIIQNEDNEKAAVRQQTQYEFEKAQLIKEQQEQEQERKEREEKERRDNIQYSMIFLGILLVFGSILGLGFIKVSPKFAEGLIFFAFLIFFEFCLVLLDPIIDDWSGGEPIYKLLFNAILAGAIFPLHAFFEKKLKTKII
jgi:tetratricopeptide (TPR) repeat protein